jgi:hypothetical protein
VSADEAPRRLPVRPAADRPAPDPFAPGAPLRDPFALSGGRAERARARRAALALFAVLALSGCTEDRPAPPAQAPPAPAAPSPAPSPASPPARKTVLVLVGETLGWLEPCGCTEGMLGGIARRASFLRQLEARGYDPVVLDLGDDVEGPGRQSELKLAALERARALMNRSGMVVATGERDLEDLRSHTRVPPSNLRAPGLAAPLPPVALDRVQKGGRAAVVDVLLSASYRADVESHAGWKLADPAPAPGLADRARIVLYHGPRDEARRLFADRKDLALVFAGHEEEVPAPAERLPGGAWLASAGDKGKFAVVVELAPEVKPWPPAPLDDRVPDDPEVAAIVDEYKRRLDEENLVASLPQRAPETGGQFIGPEACKTCHPAQYAAFTKMKHAHAYDALVPKKATRDPECLRCHTTGFGYQSGFHGAEETPHLAFVSCESCHGVGSNHAAAPQPGFGIVKDPAAICARCHDRENSPAFDFKMYWEKIKH